MAFLPSSAEQCFALHRPVSDEPGFKDLIKTVDKISQALDGLTRMMRVFSALRDRSVLQHVRETGKSTKLCLQHKRLKRILILSPPLSFSSSSIHRYAYRLVQSERFVSSLTWL